MRLISNRPGLNAASEFTNGDLGFVKANVVSVFSGPVATTVAGTTYARVAVINYYDADSAFPDGGNPDGWVTDAGWNRKLVLLGNDFQFDGNGIPLSGSIEAVFVMNVNEDVLFGMADLTDMPASAFHSAWTSPASTDDKALFKAALSSNDLVNGTASADELFGYAGNDTIKGFGSGDLLNGGLGNDKIYGGKGSDVISGGAGRDALFGGNGLDDLLGQNGNDRLFGGGGADILNGGKGNDTLHGNKGTDTFVFAGQFGQDVITDFDALALREKIDISKVAPIRNFKDLDNNHMQQVGRDVVIDDLQGNTITLRNTLLGDLDASDFLF